jgi:glutaredoxin-related protein
MKPKFILSGFLLFSLIILSLGSIFPAINQNVNENNEIKINDSQINKASPFLINTPNPTNATSTNSNNPSQNELTLFYGEGCPHCAIVEDYLKENPLKFNLKQKEIYYNEANQKELAFLAKTCGLKDDKIGIPFLWTGSNCIIGDQPIINYFKQLSK